jgi:antitoxin (DNA-binding transcriptional repressor) of toxin-antitoxin stability system
MKTIQSDYLRRHPRDVLNEVERDGEQFTVLRYQTPAAVIVPYDWHRTVLIALAASDHSRALLAEDLLRAPGVRDLGAAKPFNRHEEEQPCPRCQSAPRT